MEIGRFVPSVGVDRDPAASCDSRLRRACGHAISAILRAGFGIFRSYRDALVPQSTRSRVFRSRAPVVSTPIEDVLELHRTSRSRSGPEYSAACEQALSATIEERELRARGRSVNEASSWDETSAHGEISTIWELRPSRESVVQVRAPEYEARMREGSIAKAHARAPWRIGSGRAPPHCPESGRRLIRTSEESACGFEG